MHVFIIFSLIETLGSPYSYLCVLSIMNLKLFDTYRIFNSRVLAVTLGYLGDIRDGSYASNGVIFSTNS